MHSLLFFEFLGTSELLVILVVALVIFGPRKLPELGRSLGKAMHQFREASDSLKRTWETEAMLANASAPAHTPALPARDTSAEGTPDELASTEAFAAAPTDAEDHALLNETDVRVGAAS
jgi:sec-independent protein translocase protein TatA